MNDILSKIRANKVAAAIAVAIAAGLGLFLADDPSAYIEAVQGFFSAPTTP